MIATHYQNNGTLNIKFIFKCFIFGTNFTDFDILKSQNPFRVLTFSVIFDVTQFIILRFSNLSDIAP